MFSPGPPQARSSFHSLIHIFLLTLLDQTSFKSWYNLSHHNPSHIHIEPIPSYPLNDVKSIILRKYNDDKINTSYI